MRQASDEKRLPKRLLKPLQKFSGEFWATLRSFKFFSTLFHAGMPMRSHKNAELHFVVSPCVQSTCALPQRGRDRSSEGAERGEYVCPYIVSEIISSDLDES